MSIRGWPEKEHVKVLAMELASRARLRIR